MQLHARPFGQIACLSKQIILLEETAALFRKLEFASGQTKLLQIQ